MPRQRVAMKSSKGLMRRRYSAADAKLAITRASYSEPLTRSTPSISECVSSIVCIRPQSRSMRSGLPLAHASISTDSSISSVEGSGSSAPRAASDKLVTVRKSVPPDLHKAEIIRANGGAGNCYSSLNDFETRHALPRVGAAARLAPLDRAVLPGWTEDPAGKPHSTAKGAPLQDAPLCGEASKRLAVKSLCAKPIRLAADHPLLHEVYGDQPTHTVSKSIRPDRPAAVSST